MDDQRAVPDVEPDEFIDPENRVADPGSVWVGVESIADLAVDDVVETQGGRRGTILHVFGTFGGTVEIKWLDTGTISSRNDSQLKTMDFGLTRKVRPGEQDDVRIKACVRMIRLLRCTGCLSFGRRAPCPQGLDA